MGINRIAKAVRNEVISQERGKRTDPAVIERAINVKHATKNTNKTR